MEEFWRLGSISAPIGAGAPDEQLCQCRCILLTTARTLAAELRGGGRSRAPMLGRLGGLRMRSGPMCDASGENFVPALLALMMATS